MIKPDCLDLKHVPFRNISECVNVFDSSDSNNHWFNALYMYIIHKLTF